MSNDDFKEKYKSANKGGFNKTIRAEIVGGNTLLDRV